MRSWFTRVTASNSPSCSTIWPLDVYFDPPPRLSRISPENETTMSRPDCEKRFLTLLSQFEKNYGGFSPVNAQHAQNEARKSDGPRYVDIVATWSARDGDTAIGCLMDIYYNGK